MHQIDGFNCGEEALDRWLIDHAHHAQKMRTARTFVWHRGDQVVVAYFSLAAHVVARSELAAAVGRGSPDFIPAILLARLALASELQGSGLGGELLWDALTRSVKAAEQVGARLVVVDALNNSAASFYIYHGFRPVPANPHRLVQKTSDISAALDTRTGRAPR